MRSEFLNHIPAPLIAFFVFLLIILANWLGYRFKKLQVKRFPNDEIDNVGAIEGSLLGLMGLLLAFSFGAAASKYDIKRELIMQESNNIGTAILRCDLYPDSLRNILRANFKEYVETRIAYYEAADSESKNTEALQKGSDYSKKIWQLVANDSQNPGSNVRAIQMIPAVNSVIDIASTREATRTAKIPSVILFMLFLLMISSGFLVGYGQKSKKRNHVMTVAFAMMTTLALYLVIELDRPRHGIINLDSVEKQIIDLRSNFR